ncbi:MAG: DeoR family transcriptional regulator, partial [Rhodobacterales bacterium]|nr:DeoR family transcriptional regulator [Rhodobacterales bacterium]MDX5391850.1 DeoR family transcriptional regulator [Rhodobacterales bacterium]MDX5491550.1 DeoR family transcriptional regulator [Rhodobacterales bacterium]
EFHQSEVRATERMRRNAKQSILVIDRSKFGRMAPAVGGNLSDIDMVVCDRPPAAAFSSLVESLGPRIIFAEDTD